MSSTPLNSSENAGYEPQRLKRIRTDAGHREGPGRGSLLSLFRVGGGPRYVEVVPERRAEPRHQHVECLAWVGWRVWRGFQMNDAVLIDLSRGGARVFLDTPPPPGHPLWVYLETPGQNAVVKACVVEVEATAQGQCAVRVEFREPCPYALFEAAVCGLHSVDPRTRPHRPHVVRPAERVSGPTTSTFAPPH